VAQSEKVHANNGDRALFSARCEMERSDDESAYGRERPRFRCRALPGALVVPALQVLRGEPDKDRKAISTISNGSETDRDLASKKYPPDALCAT
jgi:hypothetical protein